MFFMVTCVWFRTNDIDFETKFFFEMHQVLQDQGYFFVARVSMVALNG